MIEATAPVESAVAIEMVNVRPSAFQALKAPNYRAFWIGSFLSNIGTWMQSVAQGWLVLQLERASVDPNQLVLVEAVEDCLQTFEVGARVRLRSGGPTALVVDVRGEEVTIAWSAGGAALEAHFNARCLSLTA